MSRLKVLGFLTVYTFTVSGTLNNQRQFLESVCTLLTSIRPEITGYIKHESFFDSRQVVAFGDGEALLWPENKSPDFCCNDINAQSQFNMVPIETRVDLRWCGPRIGNAQSSLAIEGDFFGPTDPLSLLAIVNIVQLRHAFVQLEWTHTKLLAGHYWHPLTTMDCYPDTISNNSGGPFDPDSKVSQIRLTHTRGLLTFLGAAMMQLNYPNTGPIGLSTTYERNSLVPDVHGQAYIETDTYLLGVALDYKLLKPRLSTDKNYKTSITIGSAAAMIYAGIQAGDCTFNTKLTWGQNMTDLSMVGGYAVHSIDPVTDIVHYTTLDVIGWWADISFKKKNWVPGLFVGLSKNLGAPKSIHPDMPNTIYALGQNIDLLMRISPRIRWSYTDAFIVGVETEYTSAAFGTIQKNGTVRNTNTVGNLRLLVALYYNF